MLELPFFTFIPLPAFNLFRALEEPLYPRFSPHYPFSGSYTAHRIFSHPLPSARPQDHQTKLIHTFSVSLFATLPPPPLLFDTLSPISATTGSVVYTWEDDRPFTKLRPIHEPVSFAREDCPLPTRVKINSPVPTPNRRKNQHHHKQYPRRYLRCRRVQQRIL